MYGRNENDELLQHLILEYRRAEETPAGGFGTMMLHESYGYPDYVDWVVRVLGNDIVRRHFVYFFKKRNRNSVKTVTADDMGVFQKITFFDDYELKLIVHNTIGRNDYRGSYDIRNSILEYRGDDVYFKPLIEIEIYSDDFSNFCDTLFFAMGHEFTHAYNDYMLFKNTVGRLRLSNYYDKINYRSLGKGSPIFGRREIGIMLKHLAWFEQNAYVSQLRQELSKHGLRIDSPEKASEAIRSTEAYKVLQSIENAFLEYFCRRTMRDNEKELVMLNVNELAEKDFKSFEEAKKYVASKIERWRHKFYSNASKIACELYIGESCKDGI